MTHFAELIGRFLRQLLTGPGSQEYELVRGLTAFAVLIAIGLKVYAVVALHEATNLIEFGTGVGGLILSGGLGAGFKDRGAAAALNSGCPQ